MLFADWASLTEVTRGPPSNWKDKGRTYGEIRVTRPPSGRFLINEEKAIKNWECGAWESRMSRNRPERWSEVKLRCAKTARHRSQHGHKKGGTEKWLGGSRSLKKDSRVDIWSNPRAREDMFERSVQPENTYAVRKSRKGRQKWGGTEENRACKYLSQRKKKGMRKAVERAENHEREADMKNNKNCRVGGFCFL